MENFITQHIKVEALMNFCTYKHIFVYHLCIQTNPKMVFAYAEEQKKEKCIITGEYHKMYNHNNNHNIGQDRAQSGLDPHMHHRKTHYVVFSVHV
jgi:hypothetical protein